MTQYFGIKASAIKQLAISIGAAVIIYMAIAWGLYGLADTTKNIWLMGMICSDPGMSTWKQAQDQYVSWYWDDVEDANGEDITKIFAKYPFLYRKSSDKSYTELYHYGIMSAHAKKAEQGNAWAQIYIGDHSHDANEKLKYYLMATEQGNPKGAYEAARWYTNEYNWSDITPDTATAIDYYKKAAEANYRDAAERAGKLMLIKGDESGVDYLQTALANKSASAAVSLAQHYAKNLERGAKSSPALQRVYEYMDSAFVWSDDDFDTYLSWCQIRKNSKTSMNRTFNFDAKSIENGFNSTNTESANLQIVYDNILRDAKDGDALSEYTLGSLLMHTDIFLNYAHQDDIPKYIASDKKTWKRIYDSGNPLEYGWAWIVLADHNGNKEAKAAISTASDEDKSRIRSFVPCFYLVPSPTPTPLANEPFISSKKSKKMDKCGTEF